MNMMSGDERKALIEQLLDEDHNWHSAACVKAATQLQALKAENERLREALTRIAIGDGIGGSDAELQCADIARAALGEQQ